MLTFLLELRRRSVFRVAGGYMVVTWLVVQLALAFETALQLPDWFASAITVALLIGFPVAIIVAWAFELTPDGIKRTEEDTDFSHGREHRLRFADGVIAAALVAVVGLMGWNMTRALNVASLEIPIGKAVADACSSPPAVQVSRPSQPGAVRRRGSVQRGRIRRFPNRQE